jgi:hypothetical protein
LVPELTGSASSCCFQFQGSSLSSWFVFSLPGRDAFQHVGQLGDSEPNIRNVAARCEPMDWPRCAGRHLATGRQD